MAAVDAIAETVDLTLVLDPAELWPDPADCPDWPILPANFPDAVIRSRGAAEQRLAAVSRALNQARGRLRHVTAKERQDLQAEHFATGSHPALQRFGVEGLRPIHPYQDGKAPLIAEAALIRGYLRKLDARAVKEAEAAEKRRVDTLRDRLDRYLAGHASVEAKLAEASEGAARHRQRIADEQAFRDENDLRRQLAEMHREAVSAANDLGIDPPSRPEAVK